MIAPAASSLNSADFEVTPAHPIYAKLYYRSTTDSVSPAFKPTQTADFVLKELRDNIDRLIDYSLEELDEYENHAKQRMEHYRSLLKAERRSSEEDNETSTPKKPVNQLTRKRSVTFANEEISPATSPKDRATAGPSKGILRNGNMRNPMDREREKLKTMGSQVVEWESNNDRPVDKQKEASKQLDEERREKAINENIKKFMAIHK
jgi:hypothetical protein